VAILETVTTVRVKDSRSMMQRLQKISGSYLMCALALIATFGITRLYLQQEQIEPEPLMVKHADSVELIDANIEIDVDVETTKV
jgi:hypothetical protein